MPDAGYFTGSGNACRGAVEGSSIALALESLFKSIHGSGSCRWRRCRLVVLVCSSSVWCNAPWPTLLVSAGASTSCLDDHGTELALDTCPPATCHGLDSAPPPLAPSLPLYLQCSAAAASALSLCSPELFCRVPALPKHRLTGRAGVRRAAAQRRSDTPRFCFAQITAWKRAAPRPFHQQHASHSHPTAAPPSRRPRCGAPSIRGACSVDTATRAACCPAHPHPSTRNQRYKDSQPEERLVLLGGGLLHAQALADGGSAGLGGLLWCRKREVQ